MSRLLNEFLYHSLNNKGRVIYDTEYVNGAKLVFYITMRHRYKPHNLVRNHYRIIIFYKRDGPYQLIRTKISSFLFYQWLAEGYATAKLFSVSSTLPFIEDIDESKRKIITSMREMITLYLIYKKNVELIITHVICHDVSSLILSYFLL